VLELSALSCLTSSFLYNSGCKDDVIYKILYCISVHEYIRIYNGISSRENQKMSYCLICSGIHRAKAYLDQTEAGIATVLQAANAELDIGQVEPVR